MMSEVSRRLLEWYARSARRLPWRGERDPYRVWVSEVMLQQTRVETVIPYYLRWIERFPTLHSLAEAPLEEVLKTWEGLGYYRRAVNMHRAARLVIDEYGGQLPKDCAALQKLPGIGRYSAAAIASIAFGQDELALDGNVRRVVSRVFNVSVALDTAAGERAVWELAREHLPPGQAGDYNQAWMDLGTALCTPRKPDCPHCPLADICAARALGVQEERPVARVRQAIPHVMVAAGVLHRDGLVLIARRPEGGLLGGLWEFPGGKQESEESLTECLERELLEELGVKIEVGEKLGVFKHAYTHFRVTLHAFACRIVEGEPRPVQPSAIRWVALSQLGEYPMGKIDRQLARLLQGVGDGGG